MSKIIEKWQVVESEEIFKVPYFRMRKDVCRLPDGRIMPRYYVIEFVDWVNIVALTDDNQLVMVEQYRHGDGQIHLEIPGGSTHPGPNKEDPETAALRELLEETGYAPNKIKLLGKHSPNPSLQNNHMITFLATGCKKVAEQNLDPFEDLNVRLMPVQEVFTKALKGEIAHSIVSASLLLAMGELGFSTNSYSSQNR